MLGKTILLVLCNSNRQKEAVPEARNDNKNCMVLSQVSYF